MALQTKHWDEKGIGPVVRPANFIPQDEKSMTANEFFSGEIQIEPIGFVKNDVEQPPLVATEDGLHRNDAGGSAMEAMRGSQVQKSEIVLAPHLAELLEGIDEYSHLVVLYWGHAVPPHGRRLAKTHPAGLEKYPKQGIFSTCSPARPNPVLMKVVRVLKRDGTHLTVEGLDAIDQSPVLDIKPYVADMYPQDNVRIPDWMAQIQKEFGRQ